METETEKLLEELARNASISRYRHFMSAGRHNSLNSWIGVPVVLINIALGSIFFAALSEDIPSYAKWISAGLALTAALLSGIQTFFNFTKMFEGHRRLGNRYLELVREIEGLLASFHDGIMQMDELSARIEAVNKSYIRINHDSEDFPTGDRAFKEALKQEGKRIESKNMRKA